MLWINGLIYHSAWLIIRNINKTIKVQQIESAMPSIEHHILVLLIGAAIGSWFTVQLMSHNEAKTKAAVRDAFKAVPVARLRLQFPISVRQTLP